MDLGYLDPEVRFNSDKQFPMYRRMVSENLFQINSDTELNSQGVY